MRPERRLSGRNGGAAAAAPEADHSGVKAINPRGLGTASPSEKTIRFPFPITLPSRDAQGMCGAVLFTIWVMSEADLPRARIAIRIFVFFAMLPPLTPAQKQSEPPIVHVCDLARNLFSHDGKIVAVRGMYFSGPHGATVAAETCQKGTPFRQFGSGIAIDLQIDLDDGYEVPGPKGQSYAVDRDAVRAFQLTADSVSGNMTTTATFVGVLHVKHRFKMHTTPHQGYEGNGYGHMGRYPAELVLTTVQNVVSGDAPRR